MKTIFFTLLCVLSVHFSFACQTTITGPDKVCNGTPFYTTYDIDFTHSFLCGTRFVVSVIPDAGLITSIIDDHGDELINPAGVTEFTENGLNFPLEVTVKWLEDGCQTLTATGATRGFWGCNCVSFAQKFVTVGNPDPVSDIKLVSGSPARACTVIRLCADEFRRDCVTQYNWILPDGNLSTEERCVSFELESCPLNVSVQAQNACGTSSFFSKSFDCLNSPPPPLSYPYTICEHNNWQLVVPGALVDLDIINPAGNQINTSGNRIYFNATSPGMIIMTLTYTFCNQTYTRTIFVHVIRCHGFKVDSGEQKIDVPTERKTESMNDSEIKLFPNPATDYLTVESNQALYNVLIYNMNGQLMKQLNDLSKVSKLDISSIPTGTYVIVLQSDLGTINKKFVKF